MKTLNNVRCLRTRPALVSLFSLLLAAAPGVRAQTLEIDKGLVTQQGALHAALLLKSAAAGDGKLTLDWTDCWGRTVAHETRAVKVAGDRVPFELPLERAVAPLNFLEAELEIGGTVTKATNTEFVVTPAGDWDDYQVILCFPGTTPEQQRGLRDVGITAGEIASSRTMKPDGGRAWWTYGYPFVCTQIAKELYSAYHTPAKNPKNKALIEAKALYQKDRTSKQAFFRQPSLSDPVAVNAACDAIRKAVASQMRFKPLFYDLADETGVADLVTAWDFDFAPVALDAMRQWLLAQYGSVEAINREWGTNFAQIGDVVPLSTDEMMARGDDNLSAWADHRFFMNDAFAGAVRAGVQAGHRVDKEARLGLEGCQMPCAFGGYDYWLLTQTLDSIEPYNIGNSRELWRSFAPAKPAISTGFGFGNMEIWRLWYQALHGDRGLYVYDEKSSYVDVNGKASPAGLGIAPTYRELAGGVVRQMLCAKRLDDPIAIHYSQPSITAHWMFDVRPGGRGWVNRASSSERKDSNFMRLRDSWTKLLEDGLHQYDFVAYAQLENGEFGKSDAKVLILPQSVAMSEKECQAVRDFVDRGGTVIADCRTALMDGHCKMLAKGQLDDLFGIERSGLQFAPGPAGLQALSFTEVPSFLINRRLDVVSDSKIATAEPGVRVAAGAIALCTDSRKTPAFIVHPYGKGLAVYLNAIVTDYDRWRVKPPEGSGLLAMVSGLLKDSGIKGECDVTAGGKSVAGVELFRFVSGDLKMLAMHRNYPLRISELGPTEYQKQDALETPLDLTVTLDKDYAIYDTRAGKFLGKKNAATFSLDKYQPTILALLPEPVESMKVEAAGEIAAGDLVDVKAGLTAPKLGDAHAFHVIVSGPDGKEIRPLTRTLTAVKGQVAFKLPMAVSDPKGVYTLTVRDVPTGVGAEHTFTVK